MTAYLKKIRLTVSLVFFVFIALIFVDFKDYLPSWSNKYILFLEFVPSFFKFLNLFSLGAIGFIVVLFLTLLFGRVYCSSICPLGTLQDIIGWISKKINKNKRYKLLKPYKILRYSLLSLTILSVALGSMAVINLLDPYSNFGRISSALVRPFLIWINNSISHSLEKFQIYSLYPYEFKGIAIVMLILPSLFLILVTYLSFSKGRLYCNTICPVGTLLGLVSKYSFFKLTIDKDSCKSCGRCERVCKAGCIDNKNKEIDISRCVSCFNCLSSCPSSGIGYNTPFENKSRKSFSEVEELNISKREFIISTSIFLLGINKLAFAQRKIKSYKNSTVPVLKNNPVTPPGSLGLKHFTGSCTACHLCVSACPTQVLQPAYLEYGLLGIMQPKMDYKKSFCNFECAICSEVCPNGAILPLRLEDKKTTQLGHAKFIKDNCIVYSENTECGACSEHCPTKAVTMVPYNKLNAPLVREEFCIGCGACEYACPAKPYKAIYVEGNPVHKKAKKPEVKKEEQKVDYKEDFPF